MAVIGCLLLIVLPLIGVVIGGLLDATQGAKWGAGAGFLLALLISGGGSYAFMKALRRD